MPIELPWKNTAYWKYKIQKRRWDSKCYEMRSERRQRGKWKKNTQNNLKCNIRKITGRIKWVEIIKKEIENEIRERLK